MESNWSNWVGKAKGKKSKKRLKKKKNLLRIEADANSIVVGSDRDCENELFMFLCSVQRQQKQIHSESEQRSWDSGVEHHITAPVYLTLHVNASLDTYNQSQLFWFRQLFATSPEVNTGLGFWYGNLARYYNPPGPISK